MDVSLRAIYLLDLAEEDSEGNAKIEAVLLNWLDVELTGNEMHHLLLELSHEIASLLIRWAKRASSVDWAVLGEQLSPKLTFDQVLLLPADLPHKHLSSLTQPAHFII